MGQTFVPTARAFLGGASPRRRWPLPLSNSSHAANAASTRALTAAHIRCANCFNTAPAFPTMAILPATTRRSGAAKSLGRSAKRSNASERIASTSIPGKAGVIPMSDISCRRLIERTTGRDIGSALRDLVFDPLGLGSVRLATSARDLADTAWGNDAAYDPGWVYDGLLVGTPGDAVQFLHRLMSGDVLPGELLTEMTSRHPIGEQSLPGRPWETTGYGLGLMIGRMASAGMATGHSGGGPGSVSAVYHFADRASPCTVAAFARGDEEGAAENEVARLALLA